MLSMKSVILGLFRTELGLLLPQELDVTAFDLCPAPTAAATIYQGDMLKIDITAPCDTPTPSIPSIAVRCQPTFLSLIYNLFLTHTRIY